MLLESSLALFVSLSLSLTAFMAFSPTSRPTSFFRFCLIGPLLSGSHLANKSTHEQKKNIEYLYCSTIENGRRIPKNSDFENISRKNIRETKCWFPFQAKGLNSGQCFIHILFSLSLSHTYTVC